MQISGFYLTATICEASLISIEEKILESLIRDKIIEHMCLFVEDQHGAHA